MGAIFTGLILIELVGLQKSLFVAVICNFLIGIYTIFLNSKLNNDNIINNNNDNLKQINPIDYRYKKLHLYALDFQH